VPHVVAVGFPQNAIVTVFGRVVVNPVMGTTVFVTDEFAAGTCMAHEFVLTVGLYTYMITDNPLIPAPSVNEGFPVHVPSNLHQNTAKV
jgi:hypothetical protein